MFNAGLVARTRCRPTVATNPISKGGEDDGTILSVYSTHIKNSTNITSKHGTGWCLSTTQTSSIVHFMNNGSPVRCNHNDTFFLVLLRLVLENVVLSRLMVVVVVAWVGERWWRVSPSIVRVGNRWWCDRLFIGRWSRSC